MKKVSIIVPCFNEEENIYPFFELCLNTLSNNFIYEFIFVNDGSKDNTLSQIESLVNKYPEQNIKGINFSRNYGKESAIFAGIKNSTGDYLSLIDADLQQHPKYINEMTKVLENNNDIDMVACYQDNRKESKLLTGFKSMFYYLINKISDTKFVKNASDFRTFKRIVADSIIELNEYHRFSKGIFSWVGFNVHYMPYEVQKRAHGDTSWSFKSLTRYAIDGFVGFSVAPLKIATYLGLITFVTSLIYFIYILISKIFIGINVEGYATIVSLILLLSSVQLICLGIIGEYLSRTYIQSKNRPHYLIRNIIENKDRKDISEKEIQNSVDKLLDL